MQEREITSRIRIDELQNLLDTEEPAPKQRITAPMPAVTLEALLQPEEPPPEPIHVTFRNPPRATGVVHPILVERSAAIVLPRPASDSDFRAETSSTLLLDTADDDRDTIPVGLDMLASAGIFGVVNGVPIKVAGVDSAIVAVGSNPTIRPPRPTPSSIDAVIDAAVDAAIDAEIHNFEIEAAIDAVVLPTPPVLALTDRMRLTIIAASFALSFIAGIAIMFLLS